MELRRNLLKISEPSRFRIILGIGSIIFSGLWIIVRAYEDSHISLSDWIYSALFLLYGTIYTIEGFGVAFLSLFGKSYIAIDQEAIRIKNGVFEKEQNIPWSDIQSIEYNTMSFRIKRLNEKEQILNLPRMDYTLIQEIKKVIGSIAEDKF